MKTDLDALVPLPEPLQPGERTRNYSAEQMRTLRDQAWHHGWMQGLVDKGRQAAEAPIPGGMTDAEIFSVFEEAKYPGAGSYILGVAREIERRTVARIEREARASAGPDLRPPGGEKWDDEAYRAHGLTADHICRMWARYVDQTHPPPDKIARLIKGVTADVLAARASAGPDAVRFDRHSEWGTERDATTKERATSEARAAAPAPDAIVEALKRALTTACIGSPDRVHIIGFFCNEYNALVREAPLAAAPAGRQELPNVVKTAPERIYLVIGEDYPAEKEFPPEEVSWCQDKIDANSIEYVRADRLAAQAAGRQELAEPLFLVMAGGDAFQSEIVPLSKLDDAYLRTQWCTLDPRQAEDHAKALEHFHDDDSWTHEEVTGHGERVKFSVSFEDGWVEVVRLPDSQLLDRLAAQQEGTQPLGAPSGTGSAGSAPSPAVSALRAPIPGAKTQARHAIELIADWYEANDEGHRAVVARRSQDSELLDVIKSVLQDLANTEAAYMNEKGSRDQQREIARLAAELKTAKGPQTDAVATLNQRLISANEEIDALRLQLARGMQAREGRDPQGLDGEATTARSATPTRPRTGEEGSAS